MKLAALGRNWVRKIVRWGFYCVLCSIDVPKWKRGAWWRKVSEGMVCNECDGVSVLMMERTTIFGYRKCFISRYWYCCLLCVAWKRLKLNYPNKEIVQHFYNRSNVNVHSQTLSLFLSSLHISLFVFGFFSFTRTLSMTYHTLLSLRHLLFRRGAFSLFFLISWARRASALLVVAMCLLLFHYHRYWWPVNR